MYAVIGAGPMGLASARNLSKQGLPFVGYELNNDVLILEINYTKALFGCMEYFGIDQTCCPINSAEVLEVNFMVLPA